MSILDRALRVGESKKFKAFERNVELINAFEPELELESDGQIRADLLCSNAQMYLLICLDNNTTHGDHDYLLPSPHSGSRNGVVLEVVVDVDLHREIQNAESVFSIKKITYSNTRISALISSR